MTRSSTAVRFVAALIFSLGSAAHGFAQSPVTSLGLGYKVEPVDGRSAALGGTGLGLLGGSFTIRNPADLLLHTEPAFGLSFSGESVSVADGDRALDTGRQRFTTIRALAPFSGWAASVAFGGEFDQDWQAIFLDTLPVADGSVPFEEAREHDGGISSIDFSLARRIGPLAIGASIQRLGGSLRQTFLRTFDTPIDDAPALAPIVGGQELAYQAWQAKLGASITIGDRYVLSGSMSLPSTLTATVQDSTAAETDFDYPASFEIGGSARLTDQVLVTGAYGTGGWSDVGSTDEFTSHDVSWFGGGLEYSGFDFLGGGLPIRIGGRSADLPFSLGSEPIRERAITGGLGWIFQDGLAALDLAIEVGSRGDFEVDMLEETYSRFTLSFTLRQRN
ncbi:MAG: hypothetical protein MJB57_06935 [Gemmatimonadetes bacterium]|nr:hypothetical protein [Gemmatimonadota bacterium]